MSNAFYTKLPARGLVQVEGDDVREFLQGMMTNDIALLGKQPAFYACLLSPQGKFLHDFFVSQGPDDAIFLECEGGDRAQDLYARLKKFKLRSKVLFSVEENVDVFACFGAQPQPGYPDPRHDEMGWRSFEKPDGIEESPFEEWDKRRIPLCIPDGSRDMVTNGSTMLECRIDTHNGVSFEKGCYVGQELTARMHHRGLAKKHLYALRFKNSTPPAALEPIKHDGRLIGEMRSSCNAIGIAQIKDSALDKAGDLDIEIIAPL